MQQFSKKGLQVQIDDLIKKLKLEKHPEGGYYYQIYKSTDLITPPPRFHATKRSCSTSIYYLLSFDDFSAWHRIKSDEIWHYYKGGILLIHSITKEGKLQTINLGDPFEDENAVLQFIVPAGCWFAAELKNKNEYALVGCTVSPGFEYDDFELANSNDLISQYPDYSKIIQQLTRD